MVRQGRWYHHPLELPYVNSLGAITGKTISFGESDAGFDADGLDLRSDLIVRHELNGREVEDVSIGASDLQQACDGGGVARHVLILRAFPEVAGCTG